MLQPAEPAPGGGWGGFNATCLPRAGRWLSPGCRPTLWLRSACSPFARDAFFSVTLVKQVKV